MGAEARKTNDSAESLGGLRETLLKGIQEAPESREEESALGLLDSLGEVLWQGIQEAGNAEGEGSSGGFIEGLTGVLRRKVQEVCSDAVKTELARRNEMNEDSSTLAEGKPLKKEDNADRC